MLEIKNIISKIDCHCLTSSARNDNLLFVIMMANPIMTKVIEEYKRFTSDDKLMRTYDARDAFLVGQKMMLDREREEGIKEGIEKGIKKGIKKGKLEVIKENSYTIARNLKKSGLDIKFISEMTGLTIEEIRNLPTD